VAALAAAIGLTGAGAKNDSKRLSRPNARKILMSFANEMLPPLSASLTVETLTPAAPDSSAWVIFEAILNSVSFSPNRSMKAVSVKEYKSIIADI
jgi:hypothetical protein